MRPVARHAGPIVVWIAIAAFTSTFPAAAAALVAPDDAALDARIAAAGQDVAKLLELAAAAAKSGGGRDAARVWKRVLEIAPDNETARKGLNHQFHDGRWFESHSALAKYKRDEEAQMKGKGLARWKDGWVPAGDVPFLQMAWSKDAKGVWVNPLDAERDAEAARWEAAGYQFRADDNSWVAPEDLENWQGLKWKCGVEWLGMAEANTFHSRVERPWVLAGEHFLVASTCNWEIADLARRNADSVQPELMRLFGTAPARKPRVFVLQSLGQYNTEAGNQGTLWESEAFSSLYGAYFADCCFDLTAKPPQHQPCGVSFWSQDEPDLAVWGPYWVRWAAAQSFVDAIDPSWPAAAAWIAAQGKDDIENFKAPFWGQKKIPRWIRWGAASYVERFMKDPAAAEGADPWAPRKWALEELRKSGGLKKLDEIFAFDVDPANIDDAARLYQSAGLLIAFLLDGATKDEDKDVVAKHRKFQDALKSGTRADVAAACAEIQKALVERESAIKKFAGL